MFRIAHMQATVLNPILSLHTHASKEKKQNIPNKKSIRKNRELKTKKKKIGFLKNNHDHGITFAQNIINFLNTLSDLMLQTVDVHVATLTGWGKSIQLHLASCKLSFRETTRSLIIRQFLFLI